MILEDRVAAFYKLKHFLLDIKQTSILEPCIKHACNNNPWFTKSNIQYALLSLGYMLDVHCLHTFSSVYPKNMQIKKIGVIIPSNIPLVGFYDFLCVLLSGNIFVGKLSSSNNILLPFIADLLCEYNAGFKDLIFFTDNLEDVDLLIVTGNDNTIQYFNYHYPDVNSLLRRHRTSIGVISGSEKDSSYNLLGDDIYMHFGLGCRNVSKLFVPRNFDFNRLKLSFESNLNIMDNKNYNDNYNYQKSLCQIHDVSFISFNNLLLIESNQQDSPISVVYYEKYDDVNLLNQELNNNQDNIQCIVSEDSRVHNSINFGHSQKPTLYNFADGIDVRKFIIANN